MSSMLDVLNSIRRLSSLFKFLPVLGKDCLKTYCNLYFCFAFINYIYM